jgi:hypothetical protein
MTTPIAGVGCHDVVVADAAVDLSCWDRRGATAATMAGVAGSAANGMLVGFYALIPWQGRGNPWGPANDITGSVATAAMIPAVLAVTRRCPPSTDLTVLIGVTVAGLVGATAAGPLLVAGAVPFEVSTAVSIGSFAALAGWIGTVCGRLGPTGLMPGPLAVFGRRAVVAAAAAVPLAGLSAMAPRRSRLQMALAAPAVTLAAGAWVAVPIWFLRVGRWLGASRQPQASMP